MREENNSLKKALTVLDLFLNKDTLNIKEIMSLTGYSKSAVNRIMSTLDGMGYVYRSKDDFQYSLGNKLFFLGEKTNLYQNIVSQCSDEAEKLSLRSGLSVTMSTRDKNQSVTIFKRESSSTISLVPNVGDHKSLHCSASGKILVAFSDEASAIIDTLSFIPITEYTITDPSLYREAIREVQSNHYAVDDEELSAGMFCLAMPIFSKDRKLLCSLSISGYKPKMLSEMDRLHTMLKETIHDIEKNLR